MPVSSHISQFTLIQEKMVSDVLHHLNTHKSLGVGRNAHHATFHWLWQYWLTGELPDNWRFANMMPIEKKGWKEDLKSYRSVSLTLVSGKAMEQINLNAITQHVQDNWMIILSPCGFMIGMSWLTQRMIVNGGHKLQCSPGLSFGSSSL